MTKNSPETSRRNAFLHAHPWFVPQASAAELGSGQPVLLLDDTSGLLRSVSAMLNAAGVPAVIGETDPQRLPARLSEQGCGVLLVDASLPELEPEVLLARLSAEQPDLPVIVLTEAHDPEAAMRCLQAGAFDFLVKPVDRTRLLASVGRALEIRGLKHELASLTQTMLDDRLDHPEAFARLIAQDRSMRAACRYIEAIAPLSQPVLITGETGTGRKLLAQALHAVSGRPGACVMVEVGGMDERRFAETLFGHRPGLHAEAGQPQEGRIGAAADGTLVLLEVGELAPAAQQLLLNLLQERSFSPVGSGIVQECRARIVAISRHDLAHQADSGRLRKDLYYRLRAHHVHVPPLRSRRGDVPLLVEHFVARAVEALGKGDVHIPAELYSLLRNHDFPGNVAELEAMAYDAVASHRSGGTLGLASFRHCVSSTPDALPPPPPVQSLSQLFPDRLPTLKEAEAFLVAEALRRADNNQGIAAGLLGLTRQALNKRLVRGRQSSSH